MVVGLYYLQGIMLPKSLVKTVQERLISPRALHSNKTALPDVTCCRQLCPILFGFQNFTHFHFFLNNTLFCITSFFIFNLNDVLVYFSYNVFSTTIVGVLFIYYSTCFLCDAITGSQLQLKWQTKEKPNKICFSFTNHQRSSSGISTQVETVGACPFSTVLSNLEIDT